MLLSDTEKQELLKGFPNVELSYETPVHKKVYNDYNEYIMAIPEGKKYFAWFTVFKNQNVCILLEIAENKQICNITVATACFHDQLSYGTIFYGTRFLCKNHQFFCVEDLFYYKGRNVSKNTFSQKLICLTDIFTSEIKQVSYHKYMLIFGIPYMTNNIKNINEKITELNYKVKSIHFRDANKITYTLKYEPSTFKEETQMLYSEKEQQLLKVELIIQEKVDILENVIIQEKIISIIPEKDIPVENKKLSAPKRIIESKTLYKNESKREKVFKIKPDIQNDIYKLFEGDIFYDIAYIPTYESSVMMNKLFRNIKENDNLDALEESDDEDEFENDKFDKFVHLDRSYNLV